MKHELTRNYRDVGVYKYREFTIEKIDPRLPSGDAWQVVPIHHTPEGRLNPCKRGYRLLKDAMAGIDKFKDTSPVQDARERFFDQQNLLKAELLAYVDKGEDAIKQMASMSRKKMLHGNINLFIMNLRIVILREYAIEIIAWGVKHEAVDIAGLSRFATEVVETFKIGLIRDHYRSSDVMRSVAVRFIEDIEPFTRLAGEAHKRYLEACENRRKPS